METVQDIDAWYEDKKNEAMESYLKGIRDKSGLAEQVYNDAIAKMNREYNRRIEECVVKGNRGGIMGRIRKLVGMDE
ncbi:MAG: hypothetical protein ABH879_07840 [archaeon]